MIRIRPIALAAALLIAGPALAAPGHGGPHGHDARGPAHGIRIGEPHPRAPDWKHHGRHDNGRHVGQRRQTWARGQHMPRTYLVQRYYVRDYRQYRLAPPPPGMVWVRPYQDDNSFYLVQAATGLISQILGR